MIITTEKIDEKTKKEQIEVDKCLTTILLILNVPTRNMGYFFSKECAKYIYFNPVARFQMNEMVFGVIAKKYNISISKIERSIRHTLSIVSNQKSMIKLEQILNIPISFNILHPSVCEFLCLIAEAVSFMVS